jgi:plasmid maintenance system antidote protein VapI
MSKRNLKQRALATMLEIHETRLSEMIRGKREITYPFAQKLYTVLRVPAETVLTMQR